MFVASGNVPSNAEDRGVIVISSAIVGIVIATVVITLRFWARKISKAPLSWDDWLALAAVPSAYSVCIIFSVAVHKGLGQHAAHVLATDHGSPALVEQFVHIASSLYDIGITLVKLSALAFYHRLFGSIARFRIALIVTGILCLLWMIISMLTDFFSCSPFHPGWAINPHGNAGDGQICLNNYNVYLGSAAANVALDLVILVLPHFQLWRLQLGRYRKYGVGLIFLCGYSVVGISIARMLGAIFLEVLDSPDQTWTLPLLVAPWVLELPVGIMTICIPAVVQLGRRWKRSGFGSLFRPHDSAAAAATATTAQQSASHVRSGYGFEMRREGFQRLPEQTA